MIQAEIREAIKEARERLDRIEEARDAALKAQRDVISISGKAVTLLLAGKTDEAKAEICRLEEARKRFEEALRGYPELTHTGFAQSAYAEYTEAVALYHLIEEGSFPRPSDLNVHPSAFLLGVADLIGELRRICLERVRADDIEGAFSVLELMELLYLELREADYPDPMVPGLRQKVDSMRRIIDETRALLIDIENRTRLRRALEKT